MRTYMERPITKETIAFGVGGQLHRDDSFPDLPARARVFFSAEADFETVKYKFLRDGAGVEEIVILTIDTSTFEISRVEEPEPEPEQTTLDEPALPAMP